MFCIKRLRITVIYQKGQTVSDLDVRRYTVALRSHDRDLYAERMPNNVIHVYRKHPFNLGPAQFVFAITENWLATGEPVSWGIEPLLTKLKAIDLMTNPDMFEDLMASYEKAEATKEKDMKNSFEAMAHDMYPAFKKTFSQTNTTGLSRASRKQRMEQKYG